MIRITPRSNPADFRQFHVSGLNFGTVMLNNVVVHVLVSFCVLFVVFQCNSDKELIHHGPGILFVETMPLAPDDHAAAVRNTSRLIDFPGSFEFRFRMFNGKNIVFYTIYDHQILRGA